jgi:hypothetical protein
VSGQDVANLGRGFLELLCWVLGKYHCEIPLKQLLGDMLRTAPGIRTELMRLKRLAVLEWSAGLIASAIPEALRNFDHMTNLVNQDEADDESRGAERENPPFVYRRRSHCLPYHQAMLLDFLRDRQVRAELDVTEYVYGRVQNRFRGKLRKLQADTNETLLTRGIRLEIYRPQHRHLQLRPIAR